MRVAYFTNVYPAVTHTFIRREIGALETLGVTVVRYALRPAEIFDPDDIKEQEQTKYISRAGPGELLRCLVMLLTQPLAVGQAIRLALKIGWHSDRGLLRHFAYLAEAAVLAYWCRRDAAQHLHVHFGTNPAAIAMLASQISGIPYSFTAHGSEEFIKAAWLSLDLKLQHAAFAVCVSAFGRSQLMLWSRPDQWRKIAIVHCGLDSAFFERAVTPPPSARRLVCVGRLDENKAQTVLVAAAHRLQDAGMRCEIVLVGDGPMLHDVEDAIRRAGLQRDITITGWVSGDRVKAEIEAARAFVLPSLSENMPVVIMEALAMGRPVISTYVAGIPELVQPGKTGWLVPAGDEVALAEAMRETLATPVEHLARMGADGRAHIMEHHDTLKEAVKLKNLFEAGTSVNQT
jgi:colanic acid/amylovoran biosynthesis glycosyltransferase